MTHRCFPLLFLLLFMSLLLRCRSSPLLLTLLISSTGSAVVPECSLFHIAEKLHSTFTGRLLDQLPRIKTSSVATGPRKLPQNPVRNCGILGRKHCVVYSIFPDRVLVELPGACRDRHVVPGKIASRSRRLQGFQEQIMTCAEDRLSWNSEEYGRIRKTHQ
ncbi:hypothetical protein EV359DRAFT_68626 [Lentinula novae-zelandiae]|nr:hypothetical protein EV359DRAFT_68626 [Lentinula novae-zelandiae]